MSVVRSFPNAGHYYSNIVAPLEVDLQFTVDAANVNGLGVKSIKSNGFVQNVFMHTTAAPGIGGGGLLNPNPASGYALIQFKNNFNKYLNNYSGFVSPPAGAPIVITGAGLTVGNPYIIASVGNTPAAAFSVTTIADIAGASAGKYFTATDVFSNNFLFYNVVSGVGTPPALVGPLAGYIPIPVAYATGAAAAVVAAAVSASVNNVNGGNSFSTLAVGAAVTVTNDGPIGLTFPLAPNAQTSGFTIGPIIYTTLAADWNRLGLPQGFAPAVGQSFIAKVTGGAVGSGTVVIPGISGISKLEVVGDPNQLISNQSVTTYGGAWVMVQFLAATSAAVTTLLATAPALNSVATLTFKFDGSNVTVDGL